MVEITNGVDNYTVSLGAYNTIYKKQGYRLKEDRTVSNEVESGSEKVNNEFSELMEKPISQWSSEELKGFVEKNGIDIEGVSKVSQVREIVKNYINK